ncbi:DUF1361 domain-containing protein [Cochleicola gelatinilyticus]|nr:DUF1361 domain-containing protein [Cochleicola gelatinilyticus]
MFSLVLLFARVIITQSGFYLFLIWNLFLAIIPFLLSRWLKLNPTIHLYKTIIIGSIWLLFLPNAPYIMTDFIHLQTGTKIPFWYDLLLVSSFAVNGMLLFYLSLKDISLVINPFLGKKFTTFVIILIGFLSGFGIYLGRFQRFNSWDLFLEPLLIFRAIKVLIIQPMDYWEVWTFTTIFGVFLTLGFYLLQSLFAVPKK